MPSRVTLLPAQQTITVGDDETILSGALRAGINLPYSCRAGLCSSCRARLTSGSVRYRNGRPPGLLEAEAQQGYALLCQAFAASKQVSVQVREIKPAADIVVRQLPCRIEQRRPLAADIMEVRLRLPANEPLAFRAGQYIDVILAGSRDRFAIASPPLDTAFIELHVPRRAGSELTEQVFAQHSTRSLLRIEGPLGEFGFHEHSPRPAILVASNTGYVPLRSMLRDLLDRGDRRPLHLYWGVNAPADLYEDATVREWSRECANFLYTPVVQTDPEENWTGRIAQVSQAVLDDYPSLSDVDVYAAGPSALLDSVRAPFIAQGLPENQLFLDSPQLNATAPAPE